MLRSASYQKTHDPGLDALVFQYGRYLMIGSSRPGDLPDPTGSDWEYHTFKLDASEGLSGKGFLRIKVEAAP